MHCSFIYTVYTHINIERNHVLYTMHTMICYAYLFQALGEHSQHAVLVLELLLQETIVRLLQLEVQLQPLIVELFMQQQTQTGIAIPSSGSSGSSSGGGCGSKFGR